MDLGPHYEIENSQFRRDKHIYVKNFDSITHKIAKNVKSYVRPVGPIHP